MNQSNCCWSIISNILWLYLKKAAENTRRAMDSHVLHRSQRIYTCPNIQTNPNTSFIWVDTEEAKVGVLFDKVK